MQELRGTSKSSCQIHASVQLRVDLPEKADGLWLTAFTDELNEFLKTDPPITLSSSSFDAIEERLLIVKNVKLCYKIISNAITKVRHVSV